MCRTKKNNIGLNDLLVQLDIGVGGLRHGVHEAGMSQDLVNDGLRVWHPLPIRQAYFATWVEIHKTS